MNYEGFCTRDALVNWLDDLAGQVSLVIPVNDSGFLLYRQVVSVADIAWLVGESGPSTEQMYPHRPVLAVKEMFFPSTEPLVKIKKKAQQVLLEETLPDKPQVVFGVTPCDARGVRIMDNIFIEDLPADAYYTRRRENVTMVGLACQEMGESCFCTSLGGAPDDPSDMDIMLTEFEEGFLIQVVTEKGRSLLGKQKFYSDTSTLNLDQVTNRATHTAISPLIPIPDIEAMPRLFNHEIWDRLAESCLSCRICSYVCPTCRCFDLRDEMLPSENGYECYQRIRCWDSCSRDAYRRIAGGHTPRATEAERLRNRIFCKFNYSPRQYGLEGTVACTGCGRCIDACPVNIDITEILGCLAEVVNE